MAALAHAHKNGGWVLLQNIHLTIDWTSGPLEKRVDKLAEGAHPDFRCGRGHGTLRNSPDKNRWSLFFARACLTYPVFRAQPQVLTCVIPH
jgi:Dynein heavy chain region D6 P-loop domain